MKGKLIMDSHKITNVFMDSSPGALDATSRDYVDNLMHHSQVQPSHQKDEFAYLMANMLEWTDLTSGGGNGFNMTKIANLSTSKGNFHSNNKKVIYTTIKKTLKADTGTKWEFNVTDCKKIVDYALCIEILNSDYQLWHTSIVSTDKSTSQGLTIGNVSVRRFNHGYVDSKKVGILCTITG